MREEIREAVAAVLGLPARDLADDVNLVQMGMKSLHVMQLINGWRRQGRTVTFRDLAADPTIEAWTARLTARPATG
ncbi:phosphopantetheine-binding protein [Streptomyces fuscichromogenes]|uniref:phosphopantetheine-binding protein n=1 Tax=Streptomyces fuscichromogenes TaxID=1324013 RepID=UPI0038303B4F